MLKVTKDKNEVGYRFTITTEEGSFEISFQGNLDLYWRNIYQGNIMDLPESKSFTITKENYYLFSLFEELYECVKNYKVYELSEFDISMCETGKEVEEKKQEIKEWNNNIKKIEKYNPQKLFRDGVIEWHSDDFAYEDASIVKIKKEKDKFIVTIEKSKEEDIHQTYSVRFRTSGSRYNPFYILFMKMYHNLINYEPDYHQIHFEEYLLQRKLEKK